MGVALTLLLHSLFVSVARRYSTLYQLFLKNALNSNLSNNKNNILSQNDDLPCKQHSIQMSHEIYNNNNSLNGHYEFRADDINGSSRPNSPTMKKILSLSILKEPTVIPIFDDFDTVNNSIKVSNMSKNEIKEKECICIEEKNANCIDIIALCGYYGLPPSYLWWIIQLIEWLSMVILARLTVGVFDYIFKNLGLVEVNYL